MNGTEYEFIGWETLVYTWGPRILGAALILVAALLIGRAAKWAFARFVDKLPGATAHNQGIEPHHSVGARLGEVVYWLVLLAGVIAALGVLQLGQVVQPLNVLLSEILAYIPNVVGAVLIFFVGFVVATLAKRVATSALLAAQLERWSAKAGFGQPAAGTLANAVGTLVFVLILIPVTIAALETLRIEAISTPAVAVLTTILDAIPNVLAAAIVLTLGWIIGRWIAGAVERVLPATGFDRALSALGGFSTYRRNDGLDRSAAPISPTEASVSDIAPPPPPASTPSKIVANIVLFAVVAFSAIEAARLLQFAAIAAILTDVLGLAGRVVVGGVIITLGVLIADMLANAIDRSTNNADRFASTIVRWANIGLATAMGLRFMGIADEIVVLAFGLILGAAAVAVALAFGLGGREAAGRLASRWAERAQRPPTPRPATANRQDDGPEPRTFPTGPTSETDQIM